MITTRRSIASSILVAASLLLAACDRRESETSAAPPSPPPPAVATRPSPAGQSNSKGPRVVFLGDSLTAGLGVPAADAYPAVIARDLAADGINFQLVNAGVSGDTSAGGLSRLDWLLKQKPEVVVVALGSNDGLRGVKIESVEGNLRSILIRCREAEVKTLLLGMKIPPNYGPDYTEQFSALYARLAEKEGVPFVPFLLEGVGGDLSLNQPDGIHPTAEGHRRLAATVEPVLRQVLASLPPR